MSRKILPPPDIKIAMVILGRSIFKVEAIEFAGTHWLVPDWLVNTSEGWMQPVRMVSLATIHHQVVSANYFQITVTAPLPADLHPPADPIEISKMAEVRDLPPIFFAWTKPN